MLWDQHKILSRQGRREGLAGGAECHSPCRVTTYDDEYMFSTVPGTWLLCEYYLQRPDSSEVNVKRTSRLIECLCHVCVFRHAFILHLLDRGLHISCLRSAGSQIPLSSRAVSVQDCVEALQRAEPSGRGVQCPEKKI